MTQTGFHVPDGVEMNREQAMPDCFENHHKYVGKCPYCHTVLAELEGDALTLRGYIKEFGETPSMTASRASIAEARLAAAYSKGYHQAVFDKLPDLAAVERERDEALAKTYKKAAEEITLDIEAGYAASVRQVEALTDAITASEAKVLALTDALQEARGVLADHVENEYCPWGISAMARTLVSIDAALQTEGRSDAGK